MVDLAVGTTGAPAEINVQNWRTKFYDLGKLRAKRRVSELAARTCVCRPLATMVRGQNRGLCIGAGQKSGLCIGPETPLRRLETQASP